MALRESGARDQLDGLVIWAMRRDRASSLLKTAARSWYSAGTRDRSIVWEGVGLASAAGSPPGPPG